jgi:transcriptional regulator with XRE-family HTH domain
MFTGEQIRILRTSRGFTQKQIAWKIGLSQQRYSALEKYQRVNGEHLLKILKALRFSVEDAQSALHLFSKDLSGGGGQILICNEVLPAHTIIGRICSRVKALRPDISYRFYQTGTNRKLYSSISKTATPNC